MRFLEVVSFPDPTNPSVDHFPYCMWEDGYAMGLVGSGMRLSLKIQGGKSANDGNDCVENGIEVLYVFLQSDTALV